MENIIYYYVDKDENPFEQPSPGAEWVNITATSDKGSVYCNGKKTIKYVRFAQEHAESIARVLLVQYTLDQMTEIIRELLSQMRMENRQECDGEGDC